MLELQKFLRSNPISLLEEKYAIKATRHSQYPNLVLFKYNQIESPFGERIVRECRGIILDELNDWAIVARPFDKFFNYGEGHAAQIDWSTSVVQEKVDGSLCTLYPYKDGWHIATSGTPDAGGEVNGFNFSFADLFWKTLNEYDVVLPEKEIGVCFMFELTSQYNKVVVRHSKPGLTLLGARDLKTQQEMNPAEALKLLHSWDVERRSDSRRTFDKLEAVKEFSLNSFEEILATFPSIDPLSQEGYVVVDANFNRVKVKSPAYVALHHMKDGLSSMRALVQVALNGEIDEVGVAFPEYLEELINIKSKLFDLVVELETAYDKIKHIPVQKDFALQAVTTRCSSALFAVRSGKSPSIRAHLQQMNVDSVVSLLGLK